MFLPCKPQVKGKLYRLHRPPEVAQLEPLQHSPVSSVSNTNGQNPSLGNFNKIMTQLFRTQPACPSCWLPFSFVTFSPPLLEFIIVHFLLLFNYSCLTPHHHFPTTPDIPTSFPCFHPALFFSMGPLSFLKTLFKCLHKLIKVSTR